MMERDPGRLGFCGSPLEREAIGGYLLRAAATLRLSVRDVLKEIGEPDSGGRPLESLSLSVAPATRSRIERAFGLSDAEVRGMTVEGVTSGALVEVLRSVDALAITPVCVRCVQKGRWDITWLTGLVTVCDVHRCVLQATCVECNTLLSMGGVRYARVGAGGLHVEHGSTADPCPIVAHAGPATVGDVHVSSTFIRLLTACEAEREDLALVDALRTIRMLRKTTGTSSNAALAALVDARHAQHVEAALLIARGDIEQASQHPQIVIYVSEFARRLRTPPVPERTSTGGCDVLGDAVKRARDRLKWTAVEVVVPAPGFTANLENLPTASPPALFTPDLSDHLIDVHYDVGRVVSVVAMAQTMGSHSWKRVARPLRVSYSTVRYAREAVEDVIKAGREDDFWSHVNHAREALLRERINFADRVTRIVAPTGRDQARMVRAASRFGVEPVDLTRWLLDRWAGTPARFAPVDHLRAIRGQSEVYDRLDALLGGSGAWLRDVEEIVEGEADAPDRRYA